MPQSERARDSRETPEAAWVESLRGLQFFTRFSAAEMKSFASHVEERELAKDDCLLRQGEPGGALYVLQAGSVHVRRYLPDGSHRRLAVLEAGAVIGEMEMLSGRPYYATVVAQEPGWALRLARPVFQANLEANAPWANKLLWHLSDTLATRLEDTNARVVETLDALDSSINPSISELQRLRDHLANQWSF